MKAWDFDAVYYDGECYCNECLPDGVSSDDEEVSPIFADSEADYYPVCTVCGTVHDYTSLTVYGHEQERERKIEEQAKEQPNMYHAEKFLTDLKEPYTWPGGYQRVFTMSNGELLCFACAEKEKNQIIDAILEGWDSQWIPTDCNVIWEGPKYQCCNCDKEMETEYGE